MLTHRLKRTTEGSVSDRDEQPAFSPHPAALTRAGNRPHPPRIFAPHGAPRVWGRPVADAKSLGTLDPQQGLCIVFELGLPNGQGGDTDAPGIDFAGDADSTNASQGDSATFDVRLDLTQQVG